MPIQEIIANQKLVMLREDNTVREAAQEMEAHNVGCVLIADDEGACSGIVTDRDIALALALDICDISSPLSSVMVDPLVFAYEEAGVAEVIEKMATYGVRRLPILSRQGDQRNAIGLISTDDLVMRGLISISALADIISVQANDPHRRTQQERPGGVHHMQARQQSTYSTFLKGFENDIGLPRELAESVALRLVQLICARITANEAQDFIAQLPRLFQELLYEDETEHEKAGPDTTITAETLLEEVSAIVGEPADRQEVAEIISLFWYRLNDKVSEGEIIDVLSQLPEDISTLLTGKQTWQQAQGL